MAVPKLSAIDQRSWKSILDLKDDDLYAMLGAEPAYFQPSSTPEFLLVGIKFNKTKQTIARGKKRLRQILVASRDVICKRWESLKKQQKGQTNRALVVAIISEVIKRFPDIDPYVSLPAAELICRSCAYSLDTLCQKKTTQKKL